MLKTVLKVVGALLAAALLAVSVFVVNLVWFRPFSLDLFYEKTFITFALENPELLTSIGIAEQFGYRRHNAHGRCPAANAVASSRKNSSVNRPGCIRRARCHPRKDSWHAIQRFPPNGRRMRLCASCMVPRLA